MLFQILHNTISNKKAVMVIPHQTCRLGQYNITGHLWVTNDTVWKQNCNFDKRPVLVINGNVDPMKCTDSRRECEKRHKILCSAPTPSNFIRLTWNTLNQTFELIISLNSDKKNRHVHRKHSQTYFLVITATSKNLNGKSRNNTNACTAIWELDLIKSIAKHIQIASKCIQWS